MCSFSTCSFCCIRVPDNVTDPITVTQERLMRKLMDFPQRPAVVLLSFLQVWRVWSQCGAEQLGPPAGVKLNRCSLSMQGPAMVVVPPFLQV